LSRLCKGLYLKTLLLFSIIISPHEKSYCKVFDFRFSTWISFPQAPEYLLNLSFLRRGNCRRGLPGPRYGRIMSRKSHSAERYSLAGPSSHTITASALQRPVIYFHSLNHCCGSVTFWSGSGSLYPYHWLRYPDPALFVNDLQVFLLTSLLF
jgi:hypothetical protein